MPKPAARAYTPYAKDACALLGSHIREARIDRRMTVAELAERTGVSRGLVNRAESGDMGCSIGVVFEMAALLGIELFQLQPLPLLRELQHSRTKLTLLPKYVRKINEEVNDDF